MTKQRKRVLHKKKKTEEEEDSSTTTTTTTTTTTPSSNNTTTPTTITELENNSTVKESKTKAKGNGKKKEEDDHSDIKNDRKNDHSDNKNVEIKEEENEKKRKLNELNNNNENTNNNNMEDDDEFHLPDIPLNQVKQEQLKREEEEKEFSKKRKIQSSSSLSSSTITTTSVSSSSSSSLTKPLKKIEISIPIKKKELLKSSSSLMVNNTMSHSINSNNNATVGSINNNYNSNGSSSSSSSIGKTLSNDAGKATCYLCKIQHHSETTLPSPKLTTIEKKIQKHLTKFYYETNSSTIITKSNILNSNLSNKNNNQQSIADLTCQTLICSIKEKEEMKRNKINQKEFIDPLRFEKKVNFISDLPASLIIKLYTSYFTLETTTSTSNNNSTSSNNNNSKPIMLKYNEATRIFLQQIANCKLVPDLLEEIRELNCTFYDGCIVVQIIDMRSLSDNNNNNNKQNNNTTTNNNNINNNNTQEILLKPESNSIEKEINEFIDDYFLEEDLTLQDRLTITQKILHSIRNGNRDTLCLDPSKDVCFISNSIHYNANKQFFRRRARPKVHFLNNSFQRANNNLQTIGATTVGASGVNAASPETVVPMPSAMSQSSANQQKHDHLLLNYLWKSKGWTESIAQKKDQLVNSYYPNATTANGKQGKKKQKPSSKQKKNKFNENFPRNTASEMSPSDFVKANEQVFTNNKPPNRCRILKFESSNDKSKVWKIDIVPVPESGMDGKKFEAYITPPHTTTQNNTPIYTNEQPTTCAIGGRHAAELYARRLKDMFTSNGKTRLIMDQELDLVGYINNAQIPKPPSLLQRWSKILPNLQKQQQAGNVPPTATNGTASNNQIPNNQIPNGTGSATVVNGVVVGQNNQPPNSVIQPHGKVPIPMNKMDNNNVNMINNNMARAIPNNTAVPGAVGVVNPNNNPIINPNIAAAYNGHIQGNIPYQTNLTQLQMLNTRINPNQQPPNNIIPGGNNNNPGVGMRPINLNYLIPGMYQQQPNNMNPNNMRGQQHTSPNTNITPNSNTSSNK
ncbi:hypothetical protein ABK040_003308 [Willaertia magna]